MDEKAWIALAALALSFVTYVVGQWMGSRKNAYAQGARDKGIEMQLEAINTKLDNCIKDFVQRTEYIQFSAKVSQEIKVLNKAVFSKTSKGGEDDE